MSSPHNAEAGVFVRYPWLPYVLLASAMAFYSMGFVVGRAIRDEVPPLGLMFWRSVVACSLLLVFIYPQIRAQFPILVRHWRLFVLLAVTQMILGQAVMFTALHTTTAINVSLLQMTQPVFILFFAAWLLGDRITTKQGVGALFALFGVVVTIAHGDIDVLLALRFVPGDILIQFGTLSWALYSTLIKRTPVELNPLVLFFGITLVGGIALLPLYAFETLYLGQSVPFSWPAIGAISYVATINGIAALTFVNIGILYLGPGRAGSFYYLIPIFATLMAIFLLGEVFQFYHAIGVALVFVGVYLASQRPRTR